MGMAAREELIDAIMDFKMSGKWVYAYSDNYGEGDYVIATTADCIAPQPRRLDRYPRSWRHVAIFQGFARQTRREDADYQSRYLQERRRALHPDLDEPAG